MNLLRSGLVLLFMTSMSGCNMLLGNETHELELTLDSDAMTARDATSESVSSVGAPRSDAGLDVTMPYDKSADAFLEGQGTGQGGVDVDATTGAPFTADAAAVCKPGDTRGCDKYPFAPAIPDEKNCSNGTACTSPCKNGLQTCVASDTGPGWGACLGAVGPAVSDTCDPGNDGNCDGVANEGCTCTNFAVETCGVALGAKGACAKGNTMCDGGSWGACSVLPTKSDNCAVPGDDANCDGLADDTCPCTPGDTGTCGAKLGALGGCAGGVATCKADGTGWSCSVQPAAKDTCDPGNDANCNGTANDGCACINATTGSCAAILGSRGGCAAGTTSCGEGAWGACSIQPVTADTCDLGNDANCDGIPNEGCVCINGATGSCG
ncbi:MAG: hypothetical protein WBY94_28465, partial [Polyangiaceae bacterium]